MSANARDRDLACICFALLAPSSAGNTKPAAAFPAPSLNSRNIPTAAFGRGNVRSPALVFDVVTVTVGISSSRLMARHSSEHVSRARNPMMRVSSNARRVRRLTKCSGRLGEALLQAHPIRSPSGLARPRLAHRPICGRGSLLCRLRQARRRVTRRDIKAPACSHLVHAPGGRQ